MGHCVIIGPNAALSRSRTQSEGESPEDTVRITLDASAAGGTFSLEGVDVLLDCFLLVFLDVAGSTSTSPASMSAVTSQSPSCGPGTRPAPHASTRKPELVSG